MTVTCKAFSKHNRPFSSSKNSHFQNEAKEQAIHVKINFICMRIKQLFFTQISHVQEQESEIRFRDKVFILSLVLKKRLEKTRKGPMQVFNEKP